MENKRYSSIDQLRFIAAMCVAISHLIIFKKGYNINYEIISSIAVEVFFIISGFVLAPQIINLLHQNNFKNYRVFILRRWYRTIPLYALSLVLISILLGKFISLDFFKYLFFIQNFFSIWVNTDYFSIAWSLSVEEWFYIVFPLYLIFINKFSNNLNIFYTCIIFIFIIFILRFNFSTEIEWGQNVRRVVVYRLDSIVFGVLLFLIKSKIKDTIVIKLILFFLICIFSFIVFEILRINAIENKDYYQIIFHYVVAVWGCFVVSLFYVLDKQLENKFFVNFNLYLGKISYSIYLFHLSVIYIISPLNLSLIISILIFLIVQIILSTLLYYYFEKPIMKSRPKYEN